MTETESHLRKELRIVCRHLAKNGLVAATDGNVSVRLGDDRLLVTPSATGKARVTEEQMALCDMNGHAIGTGSRPSSEIKVHLAAYKARPDIRAVVHAHPQAATALSYAGMEYLLAEAIIPEVTNQIGTIPAVKYITPGTQELADAVGEACLISDVVILTRHGAVTLGHDPWGAYLRMEKLEQFARILLYALQATGGNPDKIKRLSGKEIEDLGRFYRPSK